MERKEFYIMPFNQLMHTIIGLVIMFFGRYLTAPSISVPATQKLIDLGFPVIDGMNQITISATGMIVLSIFIGVIYLWTFVNMVWPCFIGVFLLGASSYAPMPAVLNSFMGNPMSVQIFCLFIFSAALIQSNVAKYVARYLMTHKINNGRPWVLTASILFACYAVAFLDQTAAVFLMWPALYTIFEEVGIKKGDKYVSAMVVNCLAMILCSFSSDAIKGGAFFLVSALYSISVANPELNVQPISYFAYVSFGLCVSFVIMAILILLMKYVFRVDASALKSLDVEVLNKNPLPPMTWQQKGMLVVFFGYAFFMIIPGIFPKTSSIAQFVQQNLLGGSLLAVFAIGFIQFRGEPIANILKTNVAYPWVTFLLIATAMFFGNAVNSPSTHISLFLEYTLTTWFSGLDYYIFIIMTILIAILVTNFFNSVVAGLIFAPVLVSLCNVYGFDSTPLLACFFFTVLFGLATPAASPFSAMLFANDEWINKKDAFIYAITASAVVVCVLIFIGLPIAQIIL